MFVLYQSEVLSIGVLRGFTQTVQQKAGFIVAPPVEPHNKTGTRRDVGQFITCMQEELSVKIGYGNNNKLLSLIK